MTLAGLEHITNKEQITSIDRRLLVVESLLVWCHDGPVHFLDTWLREHLYRNRQYHSPMESSCSSSSSDDILTLDVGGVTEIRVCRHILTHVVPQSMLAARFSGRWDNSESLLFFIDFSPTLFLPLVDYLRAKWVDVKDKKTAPTLASFDGNAELFGDFLLMVDYYGLVDYMYPIRLASLLSGCCRESNSENDSMSTTTNDNDDESSGIVYTATGLDMEDTEMQRFVLQTVQPGYRIASFQIEFDEDFHPVDHGLQFGVGWVDPKQLPTDAVSMDCFRTCRDYFTGWYFCGTRCAGGTITCKRSQITCRGVFVQDNKTTTSGKYRMQFSDNLPDDYVAVLGGMGPWRLANVKVEPHPATTHSSLLDKDEED